MAQRRKPMNVWIREALADSDKEGPCVMLSLVHMVGSQTREIHSTKLSSGKSFSAEQYADMFRGKAEVFCQDLPGVQTFNLCAFYGASTDPQAFYPFLVRPENDGNNLGLVTEAPTETGRMQQRMRWEEGLLSQVYRRQQTMDDHSMRMIERLGLMVEKLTQENHDAYEIVKEMLMAKGLDDHNRKMEQLNFERATAERKKWLSYAPVLINTILGREVFPTSSVDSALVDQVAESLTEEHIMKLAAILPPELMGPLAGRIEQHLAKKRKEAEDNERIRGMLTNPRLDPEADAAGDANPGSPGLKLIKQ